MTTVLIITGIVIIAVFIIRAINNAKQKSKRNKLQGLIGEMQKAIFPNGKTDIDAGTNELLRILNYKVDEQTAQTIFMRSSSICYTTSGIFNNGEGFTRERLKQHLTPYALQYFDEKSLTQFYEFLLSKNETAALFNALAGYTAAQSKNGTDEDVIPAGYGEFGLEVTNPVPVCGVPSGYHYLQRLRTSNGKETTYQRIGSMQAPNLSEIIDGYKIFENGKQIATIYLAPYNKKTSTKAPKGFILI